jgi:hypothetical protein
MSTMEKDGHTTGEVSARRYERLSVADLVAHDPSIILRALQEVERRMERAFSGERHELEE